MRIAIIHGNDGSDVRVGKLCRTLSRRGHEIHFIGWDRRPDEEKTIDLGAGTSHLMVLPTKNGRATMTGQLRFSAHILRILKTIRPQVLSAVNEDTTLMVLPFKNIWYESLVCEIFDSLVDRHSGRNRVVRAICHIVSSLSRWRADRLVVTDEARLERIKRHREKCVVIQNYPEDPGSDIALRSLSGPYRIFVSGSLNLGRGLQQILAAVDTREDFRIVSAGWLYDEYSETKFRGHPKVEFLGILTSQQALSAAADCDAMFAFYAPTSVNNLFASPNKIYDAISVGRPTIINSETRIASWVVENELGWSCEYGNEAMLQEVLAKVAANRECLADKAVRFRHLFVGNYSWNSIEDKVVDAYTKF